MKKRLLSLAYCCVVVCSFFFTGNAISIPLENIDSFSNRPQGSTNSLNSMSELIKNPSYFESTTKSKISGLTTAHLEKQFRQHGHLASILKFSPDIIKSSPNDHLIHYLYSLALSASGDAKIAKAIIRNVPSGSKNRLYELIAKSMIAKVEKNYKSASNYISQAIKIDSTHPYPYNILGRIHLEKNRLNKALKSFQKATSLSPDFYIAYTNAGVVQYTKGSMYEAAASFQKAINLSPNSCAALIGHAVVAENLNKTNIAIADLQKCRGNHQLSRLAKKNLVSLYVKSAQLENAEKQARGLLSSDPDFANLHLGSIYLRQGNILQARKHLEMIAKETPEKLYLQSWSEFLSGEKQSAISLSNKVVKENPDFIGALVANGLFKSYRSENLSQTYIDRLKEKKTSALFASFLRGNEFASKKEFSSALKSWKKSKQFFRGFSVAGVNEQQLNKGFNEKEKSYINLGVLLYMQKFNESAMTEFNKALKVNPDSLLANYYTGLLFSDKGDYKNSLNHLKKTLIVSPEFFSANYALAEIYLSIGKQDMAIKHYDSARTAKSDVGVLVKLGLLYEANKSFENAEKMYSELANSFPDNFIGFNQLAWLYAKRGIKTSEALTLAEKANKLRPNNIGILDTLGWIYVNKKVYKTALVYLQKANNLSGNKNPDVLYHLAYAQNASGDKKNAMRNVKKALKISSKFETMEQAKQLLSNL